MALIDCPECGKPVSTKAAACPNCGAPQSQQIETSRPITPVATPPPTHKAPSTERLPWFKRTWLHVVLLLFFPYLQVPLMWLQKKFAMPVRLTVTVVGLLLTIIYLAASYPAGPDTPPVASAPSVAARKELSASISENPSEKLVGMSEIDSFEYGRLWAHAMFDYIKAKSADPQGQSAFGSISDETIRSKFLTELDSETVEKITDAARSSGIKPSVIDNFFAGWKAGSKEVREGR